MVTFILSDTVEALINVLRISPGGENLLPQPPVAIDLARSSIVDMEVSQAGVSGSSAAACRGDHGHKSKPSSSDASSEWRANMMRFSRHGGRNGPGRSRGRFQQYNELSNPVSIL
jgi:hypothetical protein